MKYILSALLLILNTFFLNAQSFQVKDLKSAVGKWEGTLTYLDYSTAKPYTMPAIFKISLTKSESGYIVKYEYPDEPHANTIDTTYFNGKLFGRDKIVEFKKASDGAFTLITETDGEDGNENKKAKLRHTYTLKDNKYSVVKQVKFDGSDKWIKRNEYLLNRGEK